VLVCTSGQGSKKAAAELRTTEHTVARWRGRFTTQRLDGLTDEPRPRRPPSVLLDKVEEVVVRTLEEKPDGAVKHRSRASMARRSGMPERRTHDYARHGVTSGFAAFNIADGTVTSELRRSATCSSWPGMPASTPSGSTLPQPVTGATTSSEDPWNRG
jgi:homeodomain-containing protein